MNESNREREYKERQGLVFDSNTTRGIEDGVDNYPSMLGFESKDKFLEWIKDGMVLDLGSGFGGMARDLKIEEDTTGKNYGAKIVSMNPSFLKEGSRKRADLVSHEHFVSVGRIGSELADDSQFVEHVNDAHNKYAVAGTWSDLPFADDSFDRVMATYSFPFYEMATESTVDEKIAEVVREIKRVLKFGGEARLYPIFPPPDKHGATLKRKEIIALSLLKVVSADADLKYSLFDPTGKNFGKCLIITKLLPEAGKNRT